MMHDGGWSGWWMFGLGHGLLGLLIWVLIIAAIVFIVKTIFSGNDK